MLFWKFFKQMLRNILKSNFFLAAIFYGLCGGAWLIVWVSAPNNTKILFNSPEKTDSLTIDKNCLVSLQINHVLSPLNTRCVNLNKASIEELISLPGIGNVIAERIIKFRHGHGSFKEIDDLNNINGIGTNKIAKLRDKVCCN